MNEFDLTGQCAGRLMQVCGRGIMWADRVITKGAVKIGKALKHVTSKTVRGAKYVGRYVFGYKSPLYGNPTLKDFDGKNAARSGFLNHRKLPIRTGWSVNGKAAGGPKPVFRTSIGYGKYTYHINWKYGKFY